MIPVGPPRVPSLVLTSPTHYAIPSLSPNENEKRRGIDWDGVEGEVKKTRSSPLPFSLCQLLCVKFFKSFPTSCSVLVFNQGESFLLFGLVSVVLSLSLGPVLRRQREEVRKDPHLLGHYFQTPKNNSYPFCRRRDRRPKEGSVGMTSGESHGYKERGTGEGTLPSDKVWSRRSLLW